jgi:hypothetical protein
LIKLFAKAIKLDELKCYVLGRCKKKKKATDFGSSGLELNLSVRI